MATAREAADFAARILAEGAPEKAADAFQSALNSWNRAVEDFPALALMIDRDIGNEVLAIPEDEADPLGPADAGAVHAHAGVPPRHVLEHSKAQMIV